MGCFKDFITHYEGLKADEITDLCRYCYIDSLIHLNRFEDAKGISDKLNSPECDLLNFYINLCIFDSMPSYYFSDKDIKKCDFFGEFDKLFKDFESIYSKYANYKNKNKNFFSDLVLLNNLILLYFLSDLFTDKVDLAYKKRFDDIRRKIISKFRKVEQGYPILTEEDCEGEDRIWRALIYDAIGEFYDSIDESTIDYYIRSLNFKFNIFAIHDIVGYYYDAFDENEDYEQLDNGKIYIDVFQSYLEEKCINFDRIDYIPFIDLWGSLEESNIEKERDYYQRCIQKIENMVTKTIYEYYPYFNLADLESRNKNYCSAVKYYKESLKILENATGFNLKDFSEGVKLYKFIPYIVDFQDILYYICDTIIDEKKSEPENIDSSIKEYLDYLYNLGNSIFVDKQRCIGRYEVKANIDFDFTILKFRILCLNKKYEQAKELVENTLGNYKDFFSYDQEASLKARLAYVYYELGDFESSHEHLDEALKLEETNSYALRFVARLSQKGSQNNIEFLSKSHFKKIAKIAIAWPITIFLYLFFISLTGNIFLSKVLTEHYGFVIVFLSIVIPLFIVLFYPIVYRVKVGNLEFDFSDDRKGERRFKPRGID